MIEYDVIVVFDNLEEGEQWLDRFTNAVNNRLRDDWKLQGGVSVSYRAGTRMYAQAITRHSGE